MPQKHFGNDVKIIISNLMLLGNISKATTQDGIVASSQKLLIAFSDVSIKIMSRASQLQIVSVEMYLLL